MGFTLAAITVNIYVILPHHLGPVSSHTSWRVRDLCHMKSSLKLIPDTFPADCTRPCPAHTVALGLSWDGNYQDTTNIYWPPHSTQGLSRIAKLLLFQLIFCALKLKYSLTSSSMLLWPRSSVRPLWSSPGSGPSGSWSSRSPVDWDLRRAAASRARRSLSESWSVWR